ncbi:hypothetical protein TWF192_005188 [Orbilia oligospora]|uniref:Uncharacterized protein n=1 Tax=Orbilia oligospora TaxID=2813651 RepID=A0A6G1M9M8_ORBOL|nr:hypothetical protein TWF679_004160 [Orbilia oligospora]KAF3226713.1 hypothetical protein TWF191_004536 [Orbilia oligospora]KAF3250749.1 hypothetical protein TWF192_005188 [Orbilia oligospora]
MDTPIQYFCRLFSRNVLRDPVTDAGATKEIEPTIWQSVEDAPEKSPSTLQAPDTQHRSPASQGQSQSLQKASKSFDSGYTSFPEEVSSGSIFWDDTRDTIPNEPSSMHMGRQHGSSSNHSSFSFNDEGIGLSQPASFIFASVPQDPVNAYKKSTPEHKVKKNEDRDLSKVDFVPAPYDTSDLSSDLVSSLCISDISDEDSSIKDHGAEPLYCGYREETIGKIRTLSAIIYILILRAYVQSSDSASATPSSDSSASSRRQSCNGGYYSDAAGDSGGNKSTEQLNNDDRNSEQISGPTNQERNGQSRKRKLSRSGNNGDEGDKPRERKIVKLSQLASIINRLACPFAKAYPEDHPTCVIISRQNLAGVKEHVKRNHFGGVLPRDIRQSKTWAAVFRVCNPEWDSQTPVPDPSQDINILEIASSPYFKNWTARAHAPQKAAHSQQHREAADISAPAASSIKDLSRESERHTLSEDQLETSDLFLRLRDDAVKGFPLEGNTDVASFAAILSDEASRYVSPTPSPEVRRETPLYVQGDLGELFDFSPDEAYHQAVRSLGNIPFETTIEEHTLLGTQTTDNSGATSFSYELGSENLAPPQLSSSDLGLSHEASPSLATGFDREYIPPSSSEDMLSLTQSSHVEGSFSLTQSACVNCQKKSADDKYSLIVARQPRPLKSSECPLAKKFIFHSYADFEDRFDNWMRENFFEPEFSWETMEFEGPNPMEKLRIGSLEALVLEIMVYHADKDKQTAVVRLVKKGWGR